MHYKTICLELLQQYPQTQGQPRSKRTPLERLELYASRLKSRHEAWKEMLFLLRPESDQSQISSEALELAVRELEDSLASGFPQLDQEPLSIEAAMAFIRRHTPPG